MLAGLGATLEAMSGTLAVRPASQPSRPFGRPEALRAAAALVFAVGVAALTLPPIDTPTRPLPNAAPVVETWMQVGIIAVALVTGWLIWQRAGWYARHAVESAPGRSRVGYALLTVLTGLAVAGLIPLRHLAAHGRVPGDPSAFPAAILLLLTAFGLMVLGASELRPRLRFRHTGLLPRADVPSRRSVATWADEIRHVPDPSARGERMISPLELACQALPRTPHAGAFMWNTSTVRSPCAATIIPAALGAASRRPTGISRPAGVLRWFLLAAALTPVLWLLYQALTDAPFLSPPGR